MTRTAAPGADTTASTVPTVRPSAAALGLLATPTALAANGTALTIPGIAGHVGVSVPAATWLATVFGLSIAVSTPLAANLYRRRGARVTLFAGAALIAAGVILVVTGTSLPLLIAGRAAAALGGGTLVTLAINLAGSPVRLGVVTAGSGMCGALGPLAGSLLAEHVSWHATLALSAVSLLAVPAVARRLPAFTREETTAPFDTLGAVTLVALISALVFLPRFPVPALIAAAVLAGALALRVRARPDGFVPVTLLRSPVFLLASGLVCVLSTSYFSLLYGVPRLLGHVPGWAASSIGTGMLVVLVVGSAASWGLAAFSARMSRSAILAVLLILGVLAPLSVTLAPWAPLMLAGAGVSVFVAASGQATLAGFVSGAVPERQRPTALGLFVLCYQLGGAFGPAIATLLVT